MTPRWEYLIEVLDPSLTEWQSDQLSELGKHGWEAFAVFKGIVYFKRPLPPTQAEYDLMAEQGFAGPQWEDPS